MAKVGLAAKMAFGSYQLPVVIDTERHQLGSGAPVMGVWCPELNDRSSLLTCSSCPRFSGLVRDPHMTRAFVRCRCGDLERDLEPSSSGIVVRARRLTLDDSAKR